MEKNLKQRLLKDLCARLPYSPIIKTPKGDASLFSIEVSPCNHQYVCITPLGSYLIEHIRPYLRPMSSMTEEEKEEFNTLWDNDWNRALVNQLENTSDKDGFENNSKKLEIFACSNAIEWLNVYHFDYRGLIEKGLALEATEGMYKNE